MWLTELSAYILASVALQSLWCIVLLTDLHSGWAALTVEKSGHSHFAKPFKIECFHEESFNCK